MKWSLVAATLAVLSMAASGQQKPGPADAPALVVEKVLVKAGELPEWVKLVEGMPCAAPQPRSYFETPNAKTLLREGDVPPEVEALFPVPSRKECQSFKAKGGVPGSVFLFEFPEEDVKKARDFFPSYLWGGKSRSTKHPEEMIVSGRLVWILSFPRGDPAAEWYKQRLRGSFRVPAPREHPELRELGVRIATAYNADDAEAGIRVFQENADATRDWSFGQYCLGEFGVMKEDWAVAERGYGRAVALHDSLEDPLDEALVWAALDGLGMARLFQKKTKSALPVLVRAKAYGEQHGLPGVAQSAYNLACACALLERWPDSLQALKDAIAAEPSYKEAAREDPDLEKARTRKAFKGLLR